MPSPTAHKTIALLTDFGRDSWYVGAMKGALLREDPELQLVDITHSVQPFRIGDASFILRSVYRAFAPGTVFLCVVDPTVGSARKGLVARLGDWLFVAPDNGLLTDLLRSESEREIRYLDAASIFASPADVSPTFHGRDLFAPMAARLAGGLEPADCGPPCLSPVELMLHEPMLDDESLSGSIVLIDAFGNLISDIGEKRIARLRREMQVDERGLQVEIGETVIRGLDRSYHEGAAGRAMALVGSSGYLEVAVNRGSARELLNLAPGVSIGLRPLKAGE